MIYFRLNTNGVNVGVDEDESVESAITISDLEESNEEDKPKDEKDDSLYSKFTKKINELENRCINGIGESKYKKCLQVLKEKKGHQLEEIRVKISSIIGEDLIGYWHLIDQILFYEEFLEDAKGN